MNKGFSCAVNTVDESARLKITRKSIQEGIARGEAAFNMEIYSELEAEEKLTQWFSEYS